MERLTGSIYDYPKLYDVLFSTTWAAELRFLNECFLRYADESVRRVFEPACGTGRLLWRLAEQGYEVGGIDLNAKAVAYCNRRFRLHGCPETAVLADMTQYRLSPVADAAFNLVSSFCHLLTEKEAGDHLHCVADSLRPKGLYILGFHLIPEGECECDRETWAARRGSLQLVSELKTVRRDLQKRLDDVVFRVTATTPGGRRELRDRFPMRSYTLPQFESLLADVGRFATVETYSFQFDINSPIRVNRRTEDVVYVLRKR